MIILATDRRHADDPLAAQLLERYLAEISTLIAGFDPARAAPPRPEDFEPPVGVFLVGFVDGNPVACGGIRRLTAGIGEIRRMWVDPLHRGVGIGRALLAALEDEARTLDLAEVRLDTNRVLVPALDLYRSSGYHEIDRYNDNAFAQHWLSKEL